MYPLHLNFVNKLVYLIILYKDEYCEGDNKKPHNRYSKRMCGFEVERIT